MILRFFIIMFIPCFAFAEQSFKVKDGETIVVKLSMNELTRITMSEGARLDKVFASKGLLIIEADKAKGDVFVRPTVNAPKSFSFFVRDQLGNTYTVVSTQHDVPSETIVIKALSAGSGGSSKGREKYKSLPLVNSIKSLMKGMALGTKLEGFTYDDVGEIVPMWLETKIILNRVYTGHKLLGEVYTIENISGSEMVFDENEFTGFGKNVRAVALSRLSIQDSETTFLYVVRSKGGVE